MTEKTTLKEINNKLLQANQAITQQAEPDEDAGRSVMIASVATGLTPQKLGAILKESIEGDPKEFFELAAEMEERDPHYGSVLSTRKLAVSGVEPEIVAADADPKSIEIKDAVEQDILGHPEFQNLLSDCLDALGKGIAAVEIIWDTSGPRWKPAKYEWVDQGWFVFDKKTRRQLRLRDKDDENGKELLPQKYIIHGPKLKSGLPVRNGLARLAIWSWMLKNYSVKDWAHFCEVYGQPIRVGKYGINATDKDKRSLLMAVSNIARGMAVIIPNSAELDFKSPSHAGSPPFKELAEYLDAQMSKAVLGQTMTTDDGSSKAQAEIHNEVRIVISQMDAAQLAVTINRDLIQPYVDINFGAVENYPKFKIDIDAPEDLEMAAGILQKLVKMGLPISARQAYDKFGWDQPEDGEEVLGQRQNDGKTVDKNKATNTSLSLNRQHEHGEDDQLDAIVLDGLDNWRAQGDPLLEPIHVALNKAETLEDFQNSLGEILSEQDAGAITDALAQATFKADQEGDVGNLDG